jgi:hypothetical protein
MVTTWLDGRRDGVVLDFVGERERDDDDVGGDDVGGDDVFVDGAGGRRGKYERGMVFL